MSARPLPPHTSIRSVYSDHQDYHYLPYPLQNLEETQQQQQQPYRQSLEETQPPLQQQQQQQQQQCQHNQGLEGGGGSVLSLSVTITEATKMNDLQKVREFLDADPYCVNQRDSDHVTPLHWAALDNYMEIAKLLVLRGATIDVDTITEGHTPLAWACIRGNIGMIMFLISSGADINRRDKRGYHALHHTIMYEKLESTFYLLNEYNLDVEMQDGECHTPLMWASYVGSVPLVQLLLRYKCNLLATDKSGFTALHWASLKGHTRVAEILIQSGADVNATDQNGNTPTDEAKRKNFRRTANFLELTKKSRKVAQEGRSSFRMQLFLAPLFIIPWIFYVFSFTPHFILGVPLGIIPVLVVWRLYLEPRWISNEEGRNPFWVGFFIGSYFFSVALYFRVLLNYSEIFFGQNVSFVLFNLIWFLSYINLLFIEPGTIPRYSASVQEVLNAIKKGHARQYCITCMIRKPLRSKHCRACDQCVARFDHYCPWLNNDVGFKNYRYFVICVIGLCIIHTWFLSMCSEFLFQYVTDDITYLRLVSFFFNKEPSVFLLGMFHIFFALWQWYNLLYNITLASMNITTNETLNRYRYNYLWEKGPDGKRRYHNPFNLGGRLNLLEYILATKDYFQVFADIDKEGWEEEDIE